MVPSRLYHCHRGPLIYGFITTIGGPLCMFYHCYGSSIIMTLPLFEEKNIYFKNKLLYVYLLKIRCVQAQRQLGLLAPTDPKNLFCEFYFLYRNFILCIGILFLVLRICFVYIYTVYENFGFMFCTCGPP